MPICAFCEPLIVVSCSGPPSEFELSLLRDAAGDREQRVEVAIDERQVQHLVLPDGARERGGVGLDERRVGDDRDHFLQLTGLDRGVDAGVAADLEDDAGLREVLEAAQRDFELVTADRQQRQRVVALRIGRRRARDLRADVGGGHRCAPGTALPELSLTLPRIVPVATCASTETLNAKESGAARANASARAAAPAASSRSAATRPVTLPPHPKMLIRASPVTPASRHI